MLRGGRAPDGEKKTVHWVTLHLSGSPVTDADVEELFQAMPYQIP
jgi:hypothetical protein